MMRQMNKRRFIAWGLAAVMTVALTACGEKKPSQEEVEQAIESHLCLDIYQRAGIFPRSSSSFES